jgi:hypothetical protein
MELLAVATTAIRDQYMGFPDDEIVAPSGMGMKILLRDLVTHLRGNGIDDEGSWDCDATEGIEVRKTPTFEPFTLVVKARATGEFGEGPDYAEVSVTPEFIERLLRLSRLCEEHGLESVTTPGAVDRWDREDELRIRGDSLRVWKDTFWFEAYPKHADYSVETAAIDIDSIVSVAVFSWEDADAGFRRVGDKVFSAGCDDELNDLIALYEGDGEIDQFDEEEQ